PLGLRRGGDLQRPLGRGLVRRRGVEDDRDRLSDADLGDLRRGQERRVHGPRRVHRGERRLLADGLAVLATDRRLERVLAVVAKRLVRRPPGLVLREAAADLFSPPGWQRNL